MIATMHLSDREGVRSLMLEPVSYQFSHMRNDQPNWDPTDANWLLIRGTAHSDDELWVFHEPCLLVDEAQHLISWLRSILDGTAATMVPDANGRFWPTTEHIEPNIGFGLVSDEADAATVRVFLWLESGPPSVRAELDGVDMAWFMDLVIAHDDLAAAADEWELELARFPQRA